MTGEPERRGEHTTNRVVCGLHYPIPSASVGVYVNGTGGFVLSLQREGLDVSVQTKREGLEAIVAVCEEALSIDAQGATA